MEDRLGSKDTLGSDDGIPDTVGSNDGLIDGSVVIDGCPDGIKETDGTSWARQNVNLLLVLEHTNQHTHKMAVAGPRKR